MLALRFLLNLPKGMAALDSKCSIVFAIGPLHFYERA